MKGGNNMNEKQAMEKGYGFTGAYSHDKDEMKTRLEEYKKVGYKGAVVSIPPNPLSRGHHGMGYSVYIEERYFLDEREEKIKNSLKGIDGRKKRALEKYHEALKEIEQDKDSLEKNLLMIGEKKELLKEKSLK
jgi:hypothetical protein